MLRNELAGMQSDEEISDEVTALESRGVEALTEYFEVNRERLRLFVKHRTDERMLGRLDWDDVLQDSFIVIQKRYQDFIDSPSVPIYVWMRAITGQVLIDLHRRHLGTKKRAVDREVSLHRRLPFQSTSTSLGGLFAKSGLSPSQVAVRAEQLAMLRTCLAEMNEIDREVLLLRHMEQMSNGEIAHALSIDKSAATKRYIRALKRLRERMSET